MPPPGGMPGYNPNPGYGGGGAYPQMDMPPGSGPQDGFNPDVDQPPAGGAGGGDVDFAARLANLKNL